ncbi:MAG: hypothetical protein KZQ82_13335 [Candidatus Thiodiazotropha sp. (ex Lucinoma annulata)]|nr:hypothetical protein [Candidatus Thiodiazotropha sp. (ex Lucinoma annulata)]
MGDFNLGTRASRFNLGNYQLRLHPAIEAQMQEMVTGNVTPRLQQLFLQPDWRSFDQRLLSLILRQTSTSSPAPVTPAAGPATPRPGQVGDIMRAVWALPAIQQAARRLLNDTQRRLRLEWGRAGTGEQVIMVTTAASFAGTSLVAILANAPTRELALDFVNGRDIPVPGIRGLTVQMRGRGRGAGAGLSNIGGSGVSVRGGAAQSGTTGNVNWDVGLTLDLTQLVPALR